MRKFTVNEITNMYSKKGYFLRTEPMAMNIFGVRNSDVNSNTFDDCVGVVFIDIDGILKILQYSATTDPGLYYRENPMNKDGTAIIIPGFHKNCYKLGKHVGEEALEQIAPMKYIRDANKNKVLDFLYKTTGYKIFEQNGKTNIHRAGANSKLVDKWSAGCQVVATLVDFSELLRHIKRSLAYGHANVFSYALFEIEDFK